MVTGENNNKYYSMEWDGKSADFEVKYGRVESSETTLRKPYKDWAKIYREKVNKGYKDVSHLVAVTVSASGPNKEEKVGVPKIDEFLTLMKKYTANLVDKTYSVKAVNVTQSQLDEAQRHIDTLKKIKIKTTGVEQIINTALLDLYSAIPRKMGNVKDHLYPNIKLEKVLEQEQDNLDAMVSQVALAKPVDAKVAKKESQTLLDKLGITMAFDSSKTYKELAYLLKQSFRGKVEAIFEINKPSEDKQFSTHVNSSTDKSTKILIHGTRCTSVIPILEQGLRIRPVGNFQFSGKAYGDGNYFSEVMSKSLNYTGYDNDQILLVYEVHTGKPFVYDGYYRGNSFPLNHKELSSRGFDSTYVNAGNGLLNSEIIVYTEKQNRLKYIIWLKK